MKTPKINVLIIGSGGREHAIAWKIRQSAFLNNLYIAPGNSGTGEIAKNLKVDIQNYQEIKKIINTNKIHLLIIGPEDPLVNGLHNRLSLDKDIHKLKIIGPKKEGAKLEGSKLFAKKFMQKHNIPTASFKSFNIKNFKEAISHLKESSPPFVIKVDGLAAGKGVFICNNLNEAIKIVDDIIIKSKFGKAGNKIVIETFLKGIELSVFILTDGNNYKMLPTAKDYKRIGENDTGLNTGGMGAISPAPFADKTLMEKIKLKIINPTLKGLKKENIPYVGFIFFGLINVNGDPFVIEYNVRLGDPETQVLMPRIKSDFLNILWSIDSKAEFEKIKLDIEDIYTSTVILTSGGYPEKYEKGHSVLGINSVKDSIVFHAGLKLKTGKTITNGGRVLAVTNSSNTLQDAIKKTYNDVKKIKFKNFYFRKDIGFDVL